MAKERVINQVLNQRGKPSGNECLYHCPKCDHHKKKFSVNFSKNVFKCWVCGYAGLLRFLVKNYGKSDHIRQWLEIETDEETKKFFNIGNSLEKEEVKQEIWLPKGFETLTTFDRKFMPALQYLANRGVGKRDVLFYQLGCCTYGPMKDRIIIPSFDSEGDVNFWVARSWGDGGYESSHNNKNKIVFNELHICWDQDIVLVEGFFDALKMGHNAIPLLGSSLSEFSLLFQRIVENNSRVFLALDPEAETNEKKIAKLLLSFGIEVWKMPIPKETDPGGMERRALQESKQMAERVYDDFSFRTCGGWRS